MATDDFLDPSKMNWAGDFDRQVKNLMTTVRLTRDEVNGLSSLFNDLRRSLQRVWRGCQIMPFGSIITGLGMCSSDVDCYVWVPEQYEYNQAKFVITARNILRREPWLFRQLFAITTAKVPIVKMYHVSTGRQCDISFKSPAGVRNSQLIAYLLQMDERALPLSVIIKYWSKVHHLTGTNLLPTYAMIMMVIFYLQHKNILPPVLLLQQITNQNYYVDDWNTAFSDSYQHDTDNYQNLYELLGDFFTFFSTFDFSQNIVSPFLGKCIPRQVFMELENIPREFQIYRMNSVNKEGFKPLVIDKPMCIQDVFEHSRNCAGAVFQRLSARIMLHFQLAAEIYGANRSKDFLREVLTKKPFIPKAVKNNNRINTSNLILIKRKFDNADEPDDTPAPKRNKPDIVTTSNMSNNTSKNMVNVPIVQMPRKQKKPSLNLIALYNEGRK